MAYKRTAIPFFELANSAYASSVVTFFGVSDTDNSRLTTTITLYSAKTGSATVSNPYTLDSDGKFSSAVYAEARFIAVVEAVDGQEHETGIWEPALSAADVTAAAASATAAAASAASSALSATNASISEVAAAASAALAVASVGTISVTTTDPTTAVLNQKLTVSAPLTKTVSNPTTNATLDLGVTIATNVQALAKASNTVVLVPSNLAALNADTVTTGLVRFATVSEATTGSISTAAVTPAGLSAAVANTVTKVLALAGQYTSVSTGSSVTMTANLRYRLDITGATTIALNPTYAVGDFNIVEFACTSAATATISPNGNTIDGVTAADTSTRFGDVILYRCTAAGVVRTNHIALLPG